MLATFERVGGTVDANDAGLVAWEILQRYADPATAEFDAVLAAVDLPEDVARSLRYWQREAIANVKQYAAEVVPAVLCVVESAERDAAEATRKARALLGAEIAPRTPGQAAWAVPPAAPDIVVTLPERSRENAHLLEERRRKVVERLADLG
jgi:hypothetical protein